MSDKELKLMIAGQCLTGLLANNSPWNNELSHPALVDFAWGVATALMELSKEEEEKK